MRVALLASDRQTWVDFPIVPDGQVRPGARRGEAVGQIAFAQVAELAVPFRALALEPGTRVALCVHALRGEVEVERLPRYGFIAFTVPDRDFERVHWRV